MEPLKCFLVEITNKIDRRLRRYSRGNIEDCCPLYPGKYSYHNAEVFIDVIEKSEEQCSKGDTWPHDDPRWPSACGCGYIFKESDEYQLFTETIWRCDTGEEWRLRDLPCGAMYFAHWYKIPSWCGSDGKSLIVKLPDGHLWHVDGAASNCTKPDDDKHKCWVRRGIAPNITVGKECSEGETTCDAGAGSIQTDKWHGYLRNGYLVE